jgi:hypothetical protein
VLRQLLEAEQAAVGAFECADELVELDLHASPSRFWVFWMTNTMRNVTILVAVLITSCQVSSSRARGRSRATRR